MSYVHVYITRRRKRLWRICRYVASVNRAYYERGLFNLSMYTRTEVIYTVSILKIPFGGHKTNKGIVRMFGR